MEIISKVSELREFLSNNSKGSGLGFVPTMGALHEGHISLVKKALRENDSVICSIFVNPTQFNNLEDLDRYPKRLEEDIDKLSRAGCKLLFTPTVDEIYPEDYRAKKYDFGPLDKVMEGEKRPGHFDGVASVVSRLFNIVKPQRAYFGEKDFQQLAIIKSLVLQDGLDIEIIGCPIHRELDGLAMSSRNLLLDKEARVAAPRIYKRLIEIRNMAPAKSISSIKEWAIDAFEQDPELNLEYIQIANPQNLLPSSCWSESSTHIICIACFAGSIRLIDNLLLEIKKEEV